MDKLLTEQHFHGAFGVNFSTCSKEEVLSLAQKMKQNGVGVIFPTLVTDTIENIQRQIEIIKQASKEQTDDMAKIFGIHLEGIFINPAKKGIHDAKLFLKPTIENYKLIEDDFIKIVTLAPELDENYRLAKYLTDNGIRVQAGHCIGWGLKYYSGVTHIFNAMKGLHHRESSTAMTALLDNNIYIEIIADGVHISDEMLKLVFKTKPIDKILLISDCLPCTGLTKDECSQFDFAGETIYYDGNKATSKDGTLAGSATLLPNIVERLKKLNLFDEQLIKNPYIYHNIKENL